MRFWAGNRPDGCVDGGSFPWGWGWRRIVLVFGVVGVAAGFAIGFAVARLLR